MKTNQKGIELIKEFEGFSPRAYRCPAGVLTIGFGTVQDVRPGMVITEEMAEAWLKRDLAECEEIVGRLVTVPLTENQFSALVSFVYNLGGTALKRSTLLKKLNAGDYVGAAEQLGRWIRGGGKELAGLVRRREAEMRLFLEA